MKDKSQQIAARLRTATLAVLVSLSTAAPAALLETQSNPVLFGALYWGNPTNWNTLGIPKYALDTPSDGTHNRDLNFISVAHDAYYFYVRINYNQAPVFGGDHNLWLDTDLNPATGKRNWSNNGSIGAEFLITGAALIKDPDAWDFQAWLNWDQNPGVAGDVARDVIFTISRNAHLPGVSAFNFTSQLYNTTDAATGDWYPDSADSPTGDYFSYTTGDVPAAPPTSSAETYRNLVLSDAPLAYYRLNETAPLSPDTATNSGSAGNGGNGTYTVGAKHPVAGAIVGSADTAAYFSAVDTNSTDGGVPVLVRWPESPLIRELWDDVGIGALNNRSSGASSLGLDNATNWHVHLGKIIRVAQDFDITTPPGPPVSAGQRGGLWVDGSDLGGLSHLWDTRSWATRALTAGAQINFATNGEYWITARINNTGDTAMGVGLASAADGSGQFVGLGAMWNSAGGGGANNALYISDGTLGTDSPYTIRANSTAGTINGRGLVLGHLTTTSGGFYTLEVAVFQPGEVIPSSPGSVTWQASYNGTSSMLATHLLLWLNGDGEGELDAIRVTTNYAAMFQGTVNTSGSFTIEAWLRPTIEENSGNSQSPLFNRDPNDGVANRAGWDFFQRNSGTGWNFRMFNGNGSDRIFNITGGAYIVGQWCHLVAVYNAAAQTATLYLNGQQTAFSDTPNGNYVPTPYAPISIGGYSDASQNPFTGDIDEVAIYTKALDATNVLAHYQNGTNAARSVPYSSLVLSDGPAEYLRLNEPAKNPAANSGTLGNVAAGVHNLNVASGRSGPRAPGQTGFEADNAAVLFNGANSYTELGNPPELNFTGQITLEAWIQPSITPAGSGGFGNIVAHGYDEDLNEVALRVNGNSQYSISTYRSAGGQGVSGTIPAGDLGTGAWVHLVGTFDGANWNLYRNGALLASAPDTDAAPGSLQVLKGNWAIGARGRWAHMNVLEAGLDRQFQGKIDEAAIYNRALSADEVKAHWFVGVSNNPVVTISKSGADVILTWPVGTLQEATDVGGTYSDVVATSPYTTPAGGAKKFYRVKL